MKLKTSHLILSTFYGFYAIIMLLFIIVSSIALIYNYFYKVDNKENYIYGNNKKLIIVFILNLIFGFVFIIKGIIYMQAQSAEKEYYRILENCIGFKK